MWIKEANLIKFGKFYDKKVTFQPGINLVYGENESGKSTLFAFLSAMLFGLEKPRGKAGKDNNYVKYEPWDSPSYYMGSLKFQVGEQPFLLERNFYHKEKRVSLRNEKDHEELDVFHGDLEMLLGGMQRGAYESTLCMPQGTFETGKNFGGYLQDYLSNISQSADASFQLSRVLGRLEAKKAETRKQLKNLQTQREAQVTRLENERDFLRAEIHQIEEKIQEAEEMQPLREVREEIEERRGMPFIGTYVCLFINILYIFLFFQQLCDFMVPYILMELVLCTVTVGSVFIGKRQKNREKHPFVQEDDTEKEEEKVSLLLQELRSQHQEKSNRFINTETLLLEKKSISLIEKDLQADMESLELAMSELTCLAEDIHADKKDEMNAEISGISSRITNGSYDQLMIDEEFQLHILKNQKELSLEQLSRGTKEQIYMAVRLGVGSYLSEGEKLPILLDEPFGMYDEIRFHKTLQTLSEMGHQVILFSCHRREEKGLKLLGIPYHAVEL